MGRASALVGRARLGGQVGGGARLPAAGEEKPEHRPDGDADEHSQ